MSAAYVLLGYGIGSFLAYAVWAVIRYRDWKAAWAFVVVAITLVVIVAVALAFNT